MALCRATRLLIIGAGPVGLAMADALKRDGIAYDHVDANGGLGGNWYNGVFDTTHIVSSKGTTAFADYPMPADYPDFPSAKQMLAYLEAYARDRGIAENIEFQSAWRTPRPTRTTAGRRFRRRRDAHLQGRRRVQRPPLGEALPRRVPARFHGEYIHSKDYRHAASARRQACAGHRCRQLGARCRLRGRPGRRPPAISSLRSGYWFMPKTAFGRAADGPADLVAADLLAQRLVLRAIIRRHRSATTAATASRSPTTGSSTAIRPTAPTC